MSDLYSDSLIVKEIELKNISLIKKLEKAENLLNDIVRRIPHETKCAKIQAIPFLGKCNCEGIIGLIRKYFEEIGK